MATQIGASIQVSNHANIFMPADARFFEMYAAGKNIATAKYEIEKIQERIEPKDDVTLDTISYREYPGAFAIA
jgi:hypothetical protein